ncbi:c-type cytochrome [Devosia algicola]|uniref:C-type cytochrome n=1 Tax=Devosia algicola TaxID=3026418 RepID=A0ABY7YLM9_9HYPH|nr:c-type cytochrome [Devosia algicola]WDR02210.1 c-type cytochrome [Devosia algicola]
MALFMIGVGAGCSKPQGAGLAGDPASIGDPAMGKALIEKLGCGSCHVIPGILNAYGMVGPPLEHMARRQYIAGMLRNTPENMVNWLRYPQKVVPGNAMPDLGISDDDAHQIAAYLATLQ